MLCERDSAGFTRRVGDREAFAEHIGDVGAVQADAGYLPQPHPGSRRRIEHFPGACLTSPGHNEIHPVKLLCNRFVIVEQPHFMTPTHSRDKVVVPRLEATPYGNIQNLRCG